MNIYRLLKSQLDRTIDEAVRTSEHTGREICGLLVYNGYFIELVHAKNKIKRGGGFQFYPSEIKSIEVSVERLEHEIVGTFHSHPAYIAAPSESDIINAVDDSLMLIIDVIDKDMALWHIKDLKKKKISFVSLDV